MTEVRINTWHLGMYIWLFENVGMGLFTQTKEAEVYDDDYTTVVFINSEDATAFKLKFV